MLNRLYNGWRPQLIFILFIVMLLSLFFSRAALSVSVGAFVVVSVLHTGLKKQTAAFFNSPLLWSMSLLFLLPFISGAWSEDKDTWLHLVTIKLPLVLLPFAFAAPIPFAEKRWEWLAFVFIAIITTATIWGMIEYAGDSTNINAGYLRAKMILTPLNNDHVRFSWLVSVAVLLSGWLFVQKRIVNRAIAIVMAIVTVWLMVYLHILAARTGLFSLYIMLLMVAVWFMIKKTRYGLLLLIVLIALPVIAWFSLPTFQNRVQYFRYDLSYFKNATYLPGGNDAMRVISIKTGWQLLNGHPLSGVGFGDIKNETDANYDLAYPQMTATDKIYPSSEWMVYGAGCGWPGVLVFSFAMLMPFFISIKNRLPWWLLNSTAAFSLLFDIWLEVQFGVFAYAFVVLWCWKWWQR